MLTTFQEVKETFLIGGLNIVLPTSDVYSDGALIYKYNTGYDYHEDCERLFDNGTKRDQLSINDTCLAGMPREQLLHKSHPYWANSLLVPFLLNYFAGWLAWYRSSMQKKFSWLPCLGKVGVCKVLNDRGLLDGMLTFRFILLFFTCLKGTPPRDSPHAFACPRSRFIKEHFVLSSIQALLVPTLPGLVTGLIFIRHRAMPTTFLNHPSLLLLPVFTYFTFESNVKCCSTDKTDSRKEVEISFSVRATICNALVSTAAAVLAGFSTQEGNEGMNAILIVLSAIPTIIGLHTNHSLHCCSPHLPPLFLSFPSL